MKKEKLTIVLFLLGLFVLSSIPSIAYREISNRNRTTKDGITLTIVTRHDVTITNEFKSKFLASDYATTAGVTDVTFLQATTDEGWKKLLQDPSKSVDLAWGGGPALFNTMDKWGLLRPITDTEVIDYIDNLVNDTIAGAAMKSRTENGSLIWVANAISSFGFTVNHDFLDTHGLPVPHTWEELATPTYYISPSVKAISMGDPPLTTSNTRIYQIILQAFGWEQGWSILTRMAANAGIYPGSVDTRAAVIDGEVGIAMTIDFYGVIAMRENPRCEYIVPEGQSIVNGDPIALGVNVDDYDAAIAFLKYVFSPEGQAVWLTEGIDRLPVVEAAFHTPFGETKTELYALYNETIQNEGIEFNETLATLTLDTTIYYFHQTISVEHSRLRQAWGEMVTQLNDGKINQTYFVDLVNRLGAVNMTLNQAIEWNEQYQSDPEFAAQKDAEWRQFAQQKYDSIYYELTGITPTTETTPTTNGTQEGPFDLKVIIISVTFLAVIPIIQKRKRKKN